MYAERKRGRGFPPPCNLLPTSLTVQELNRVTGQRLPETILLEYGTIRELVNQITGATSPRVEAAQVRPPVPMLVAADELMHVQCP